MLNPDELVAAAAVAKRIADAVNALEALQDLAKEAQNGHASGRAEDVKTMRLAFEEQARKLDSLYA